jgi:hypothetical protein
VHITSAWALLNSRATRETDEMLKITKTEINGSRMVFKLEGKITGQWAELLDGECRAELRNGKSIELNCADVDFLDAKGIEVLKHLVRKQVTLLSAPGYVTELLHTGGRS